MILKEVRPEPPQEGLVGVLRAMGELARARKGVLAVAMKASVALVALGEAQEEVRVLALAEEVVEEEELLAAWAAMDGL